MAKSKNSEMVCPNCGYIGKGDMKGSFLIELFLLFLFIIPALLYSAWRMKQGRSVCPKCGFKQMLPTDTPKGSKLKKKYQGHQVIETPQDNDKPKSGIIDI
tara:strand:- start:1089 stop:1391 length:303 start_codon:yes stop_codon:yes gene_type:complete